MAFHLGSLGFLTPFKFESYKTEVAKVFEGRLQSSKLVFQNDLNLEILNLN